MNVHTLANGSGMEVRVADYGGILLSLRAPDRRGRLDDVVLGFDAPEDYLENPAYFGALVGRYANRIAGARFTLDGREHALAANDGANHLHGGRRGFDRATWDVAPFRGADGDGLELTYTSPDGEEGYPGTLRTRVAYTLTERNELVVDYRATTDRPTPVNLTQHAYFNLAGHDAGDVLGHVLTLNADRFVAVDAALIPTGELRPVDGSPFDFRTPRAIGERLHDDDDQLGVGGGYDHCFVLAAGERGADEPAGVAFAARVHEPASGRVLEVWTTEPGVQLYTGNALDARGKGGARYGPRAGFALETQHFPDSPNRPAFPSTILRPDREYRARTVYGFGVRDD